MNQFFGRRSLDAELKTWQSRPLPQVFPIVFFDGIVVHVRGSDAKVSPHTVYVALGIDLDGQKQLLGLRIAKTEGVKFWLSCLTDLRNLGLEGVSFAVSMAWRASPMRFGRHFQMPACSCAWCIWFAPHCDTSRRRTPKLWLRI